MNWFKKLWKKNPTTRMIGTKDFAAVRAAIIRKFVPNFGRETCTDRPKGKQGVLVEYPTFRRTWPNLKFKFHAFGYKTPTFKNAAGFGQALERRGFKKLGAGHFSAVYGKDGYDRVVKVNHRPDNWIDYAHWGAQQGFAGGLAPKVFSYKMVMEKFQVSVVERMDSVVEQWGDSNPKVDKKSPLTLVPKLMYSAANDNPMAQQVISDIVPGLADFLSLLKKRFEGQKLDLHGENMMLRKDGSFCITDPVCSYEGSTFKRLRAGDFTPALALNLFKVYYGKRSYLVS